MSHSTLTRRSCRKCEVAFAPNTSRQVFCSTRCQRNFNRDRVGKPACGEGECGKPVRAKGLCSWHYRKQHPNRATWSNGTVETRRAHLRKKTQKRRALQRDPNAELIDRDAVGERDGWRCGICRRGVDRTLAYPDPMSASLDHIVPLSLGGEHRLTNVRISHLTCNTARGNRADDVQELLVG